MKDETFLEFTKATPHPGYQVGMNQPSLIVDIKINKFLNASDKLTYKKINDEFSVIQTNLIPNYFPNDFKLIPAVFYLVEIVAFILTASKMPVFTKCLILTNHDNMSISIALPSIEFGYSATYEALIWTIDFINSIMRAENPKDTISKFNEIVRKIKTISPSGHNTILLIKAAYDRNIPWTRIVGNIYQFGWGSRARWLDSTFTDESGHLSTRLCRNKLWCSEILKKSGLPSSEHYMVECFDEAINAAKKLKYPVVVKPLSLDGGVGVFANIANEKLLKKYFDITSKFSKKILIEKHVEGDDFRLQVHKDHVFWAVKRKPAGIEGDGVNTIEELIKVKKINVLSFKKNFDESQALNYLKEQSLSLNYIPKKNEYIKLARRANVSAGGSYENVLVDVHPDNLLLAIRAARAVRLDLAGVDILMPDIKKSWLKVGATICEINAQPQIAPEAIPILTNRLITNDGRIPIIVIIGGMYEGRWINNAISLIQKSGKSVGLALNNQLVIQGEVIGKSTNFFHASRTLLSDNKVDLVILCMNEYSLKLGMPFDRITKLILNDCEKEKNKQTLNNQSEYLIFSKISDEIIVKEGSLEWPLFLQKNHLNFHIHNEANIISKLLNVKC